MFGYITINKEDLSSEALARYRAAYCGLCRTLKQRHGNSGRAALSYEMTFLMLLLGSLFEPDEESGEDICVIHPLKKRTYITHEYSDYAADMNLALAFHKLRDNWQDEHSLVGLAGTGLLKKSYSRISEQYPDTCRIIEENLNEIEDLEKSGKRFADIGANLTGAMLGRVFDYMPGHMFSPELKRMGEAMGRFIYVMDAYEDLPRDLKKKNYNPLSEQMEQKDYDELIYDSLSMMMGECAEAFEVLPLERDLELLRNILYSGVWARYAAIQKKRIGKEKSE